MKQNKAEGAPVPTRSQQESTQKPSPFAQSHPGPSMSSQSKRSTEASDSVGVCQPPPRNKMCVETDKKVQLNPKLRSQKKISTSHLDQSSLQPRSQLNRKRALDNAGVDQAPPQKMQRLAIKVKDQQLEPGSLKKLCAHSLKRWGKNHGKAF
ncbi:unnamed protein product [Leuciscus chuanchicus]